ncbi:MAG: DEAD/DEAH box helicase, partial [Synergistaceae bacterium]|nr:DEAD/DEAH box helicase [Synergistaceae bacterium]
LRKQTLPEFEAEYIANYSLPEVKANLILRDIKLNLRKIERVASEVVQHNSRKKFRDLLAEIWYDEMEVDENLEMALLFFEEQSPSALMAAQMLVPYERNFLQALLKVKRFANQLPKGYGFRASSLAELNNKIDEIDPTIYGFEEKLNEIEFTRE